MISVKKINQKDNHTFTIEWSDGVFNSYRLSELQRCCPCAGCSSKKAQVAEDVRAVLITSIGCYALRIQFNSGCSHGIYSFELLRQLSH